jgi:hypothetical protein
VSYRFREPALIAAAVGIVLLAVLACIDLETSLLGYLCVAVTFAAIPAGALAVLLISYLVRGAWTDTLHVPLVATALTAPAAGLLFVPVLLAVTRIYPWAAAPVAAAGSFKAFYLSPVFFCIRTIVYFAIWAMLAIWARRAWNDISRMTVVASAGLIAYALTASLSGVDWLESLTPQFHSSIFGLLHLTFQVLAGYAFVLALVLRRPAATHRYGATLLSLLLLWAYNHAMQYIIIWSGNIPEEVTWYEQRESGIWGVVLWGLVLCQFVIPFFALLSERVRGAWYPLLVIASATVGLRLIEAMLLALPGRVAPSATLALAVVSATLVVGGVGWAVFSDVLRRCSLSTRDRQGLHHEAPPRASASSGVARGS